MYGTSECPLLTIATSAHMHSKSCLDAILSRPEWWQMILLKLRIRHISIFWSGVWWDGAIFNGPVELLVCCRLLAPWLHLGASGACDWTRHRMLHHSPKNEHVNLLQCMTWTSVWCLLAHKNFWFDRWTDERLIFHAQKSVLNQNEPDFYQLSRLYSWSTYLIKANYQYISTRGNWNATIRCAETGFEWRVQHLNSQNNAFFGKKVHFFESSSGKLSTLNGTFGAGQ